MKCAVVKVGGVTAIVCGSPKKKTKCSHCKNPARRLCDWKMGNGKTCDKPLCDVCAFPPAHKKDLCEEHAISFKAWKAAKETKR